MGLSLSFQIGKRCGRGSEVLDQKTYELHERKVELRTSQRRTTHHSAALVVMSIDDCLCILTLSPLPCVIRAASDFLPH